MRDCWARSVRNGPVPRDHRVDGGRHQGGDGRHDGHLAPFEGRVLGRADQQERHEQGQVHAEEPDEQMQAPPVEREPDDGEEVDDHQPGVGAALGVSDDGDDRDVADRDDEPGPVGQALPGQQERGGDEDEEDDAGDGDLPAGVVGEGDQGDQDGADGHQGEDRAAAPAWSPRSRSGGWTPAVVDRDADRRRVGAGTTRSPVPRAVAVSEAPDGLDRALVALVPAELAPEPQHGVLDPRRGQPARVVPGQLDQLVRREDLSLVAGQRGEEAVLGRGQDDRLPSTVTSWWAKSMCRVPSSKVVTGSPLETWRRPTACRRARSSTRLKGLVR